MRLPSLPVPMEAPVLEIRFCLLRKGQIVPRQHFQCDLFEPYAADLGRRAGEVLLNQILMNPDGLKKPRPLIGPQGRDTHLGKDL